MDSKRIILSILLIYTHLILSARDFTVSGLVRDEYGLPISYAAISDQSQTIGTYSDENGQFSLVLPEGRNSLTIYYIGYQEKTIDILVSADTKKVIICLEKENLMMKDVVVTARQVRSKNGTSTYRIDNQAIKQIQAMSLGDILTLLPGKKIGTTSYNKVQQPDLRSAVSSSYNNIGTALILNGMSLNNDANMQMSNPAGPSNDSWSTAGKGFDLRSISAAGIESIEVVTGVPSAKYGNLATGAVIVKNKTGVLPLAISANTSGDTYQVSLSEGFELKNKGGILNTEASYTYSTANPVYRKNYYQNINAAIRWTRLLDKEHDWSNTLSLQTIMGFNGQRYDADERVTNLTKVNNQNVMLNLYGDFKLDGIGSFSYSLNGSLDNQFSHYMYYGTGPLPLIEALETGTYITSYSPIAFKQEQIMKGLPLSLSANMDMKNHLQAEEWKFKLLSGLQFSYDKNFGKGRAIMGNAVQAAGGIGARSAEFHTIPASVTLSVFHETTARRDGERADADLRMGLRYDFMNRRYHLLSPRLAASVKLFDQWTLRAAWGLAYKAPSMLQLYPGPAYFDYTNLSYLATDPAERLAVVSTYVYQPENKHLKPSHTNTLEVGTDWESDWLTIRLTGYHKELVHAISLAPELLILEKQNYQVVDAPQGVPPSVAPIEGDIEILLKKKEMLQNNREEITDGLELMLLPAKIEKTNTEFNFQGSWMRTRSINCSPRMELSQYVIGHGRARYGLYERHQLDTYLSSGRLAIIQHFPRIGLIITLNTELNFMDYARPVGGSIYPYAYYDSEGKYHDIPEADREDMAYDDLILNGNIFDIKDKKPFYTNFHLQVRKETRQGHSFSLYANNFLWLNPTYVYNEIRKPLNGIIDFGVNMSFIIGGGRKK